jgi:hypothetical protein
MGNDICDLGFHVNSAQLIQRTTIQRRHFSATTIQRIQIQRRDNSAHFNSAHLNSAPRQFSALEKGSR